ncbi:MAG TPA: helicase-related protein [Chitinophagaceae bacterium]|nr:helicase-related protein [Chitinophagaceae bacterium]
MSTRFFTNKENNTLLEKLEGIFKHMNIHFFDALVGFFRASGYFKIYPFLKDVEHIRILVGIDVDRLTYQAFSKGLEFLPSPSITKEKFLENLKKDIQQASYTKDVEEGMMHFIESILSGKIQIRVHPSKQLHAKIYVFRQKEKHEHAGWGSVITGSSNLTEAGLKHNFEFNVELRDHDDVEFACVTFEKLWDESIPLSITDVQEVKRKSYLNDEFTPFEIYVKFIIEYFGRGIDYDPDDVKDLPLNYTRLRYQVDAVNDGFEKLKRYNGFFLADVVGLGKTIVSIMVAKKFALYNGLRTRVLVVYTPAMEDSWKRTVNDFNLPFTIDFITNGSLHKIKHPENYDLIIVDEAHKFRSDTSDMFNMLQTLCKTYRRNAGPYGETEKKVILVSATPLNNKPEDIRNLILLFQDGRNATLDSVSNIIHFFRPKIDLFNKLRKEPNRKVAFEGIKKLYEEIRIKILEPIIIRRTRTDIKENKEYWEDLIAQGLSFPTVEKPIPIYYQLDAALNELFDDTVRAIQHPHEGLKYFRYQAIKYLIQPYRAQYDDAASIAERLAAIMKTLLVKRLDSSFYSFIESLRRYKDANRAMLMMFENNRVHIAPSLHVSESILEGNEDDLIERMNKLRETDPTVQTYKADDFETGFLSGLQHDHEIIESLYERWVKWQRKSKDPKFIEFVDKLETDLLKDKKGKKRKLVIFSEFKDTTNYLASELSKAGFEKILAVDSSNQKELSEKIRKNFDARADIKDQSNDYDILLTTEVLAEGVNLHRAYTLINYDTPWNSTRLMQRIGRVNRIGTVAEKIYVYNFYPTEQTESHIELYKKALMKLQAFHSALGEDSQIYSSEEEFGTFGLFEKVGSEEERDERLHYLLELRSFRANNPEWFKQIKNMPLRARAGRNIEANSQTTITFLKNRRRDGFYHIKPGNTVEEISFLQSAGMFKALAEEKPLALIEDHYDHVQSSIAHFKEAQRDERNINKSSVQFGPNEKRALSFVDAYSRLQELNEEELQILKLTKQAIIEHRFQKLQRDINKLRQSTEKVKMKPVFVAEKLLNIVRKYPLVNGAEKKEDDIDTFVNNEEPEIIISESFH